MSLRIQSFLTGVFALIAAFLLALAPASANPASGGYQLFEQAASGHQTDIQLASLGNFNYHAKTASECCTATNRTFDFAQSGTGTHLRRSVDVDGQTVQINSGHAYNRTHSGGDVRDSGLSMDQIDNAIVTDISTRVDVGTLPQVPQMTSNTININGYSLTYDVTRLPNGNVSVSTYYPGQ